MNIFRVIQVLILPVRSLLRIVYASYIAYPKYKVRTAIIKKLFCVSYMRFAQCWTHCAKNTRLKLPVINFYYRPLTVF